MNTLLFTDSGTLDYSISLIWTLNLVVLIDAFYPPKPTDTEASQYEHHSLSSYKLTSIEASPVGATTNSKSVYNHL